MDDHLVLTLLRDRDAGFVRLFEAYRHVVFSVALRICGRWADAEDLTAESFLRAYRALGEYPRGRILALKPRSWLLTITVNLWRNQQRGVARRADCEPLDEAVHDPPDPVLGVERTVLDRETGRELAARLTTLPVNQRAAVVLRHVVDLPIAEIAAILGRPPNTIKSDIARGLSHLRALYPTDALIAPAT
jgi:RNA polymerase sigma-70 factor (ECF subfamily)